MPSLPSSPRAAEQIGPFQLVLFVLSIVTLLAIAADSFFKLPTEVTRILRGVDNIACVAFFLDFVVRFRGAESKLAYMKWGWIDLLASVPSVDFLRLGRFARILRVIRVLRGIESLHRFMMMVDITHRRGGSATVVLTVFLLVTSASVGILAVERAPESNIKTAGDAVWWSVTTITTVGYGDRFPVTTAGRVIAMGLMFSGVGLFGALSGIIASNFLGKDEKEEELLAEVKALRAEFERRMPSDGGPPAH